MPRVRSSASELVWAIVADTDAIALRVASRRFAASHGFLPNSQWAIAISASELATNVLKYGAGGTLRLRWLAERTTLEMEAVDRGPGFEDIDAAMRDHITEGRDLRTGDVSMIGRRGLGTGLGAVDRLMDRVTIQNLPERGSRVVAVLTRTLP